MFRDFNILVQLNVFLNALRYFYFRNSMLLSWRNFPTDKNELFIEN